MARSAAQHLRRLAAASIALFGAAACRGILGLDTLPAESTSIDADSPDASNDADIPATNIDPAWAHWPMPLDSKPQSFVNGSGITRDTVTGLYWQAASVAPANWKDANLACEKLELDGRADFRLPTRIELLSIIDFDKTASGIPFPDWFLNEDWNCYWTISGDVDGQSHWLFGAYESMFVRSIKDDYRCRARCVAGASYDFESNRPPPYEIDEGISIRDPWTGLEWQADSFESAAKSVSLDDATEYCLSLVHAGHEDWRLPTVKELETLVDERKTNPALDRRIVGQNEAYWSSTPHPPLFDDAGTTDLAWRVSFTDGTMMAADDFDDRTPRGLARTRCVRKFQ